MTERKDDRPRLETLPLSATERLLERATIDESGKGRPLSARAIQRERTVEGYLRGEMLPRYITRAREIERETARHERELRAARDELRELFPGDPEALAAAWRERVATWSFEDVNLLIRQHNEWYPIERDLPMDPRTGRYVNAFGIDFLRTELDAAWALERVPA
ncbi:hypothetical protein [Conexibacter sp. SYSU D00693]|uniref:hypothetical protein n=1 Tax=Conexibacter sp. SYSU D00693 TaxID=2812560 RepID=UPI00196B6E6A|nr:hypothetical protein [Conexibacter sp. SYSU D00693]